MIAANSPSGAGRQDIGQRRVYNLSLHRSGTQSFTDYCNRNGLRCLHWPGTGFDLLCRPALVSNDTAFVWSLYSRIIDDYDAVADLPAPLTYQEAMAADPDGRFLLITRDPEDWVRSVRTHVNNRRMDALEKLQYWMIVGERFGEYLTVSDETLRTAYVNFNKKVAQFASDRKADFESFDLNDQDLSVKIATFLGLQDAKPFRLVDIAKGPGAVAPRSAQSK